MIEYTPTDEERDELKQYGISEMRRYAWVESPVFAGLAAVAGVGISTLSLIFFTDLQLSAMAWPGLLLIIGGAFWANCFEKSPIVWKGLFIFLGLGCWFTGILSSIGIAGWAQAALFISYILFYFIKKLKYNSGQHYKHSYGKKAQEKA